MALTMILAALGAAAAYAQTAQTSAMSPVGLWRTIDDKTGRERSLVRLVDDGGTISGRVEKIADPARAGAVCEPCTDERKGRPIVGMQIVSGVRKAADGDAVWEGGQILDPDNGKTYKVRLKPFEEGRKLEVRGYLGPFYRNQVWLRAE